MLIVKNDEESCNQEKKKPLITFCMCAGFSLLSTIVHTIIIRNIMNHNSVNILIVMIYIVLSLVSLLFHYGSILFFYRATMQIRILKEKIPESIEIDTDEINFCYSDRKICFKKNNISNANNWELNVARDYITVYMGICYICCKNTLEKDDERILSNIYTVIKNSTMRQNDLAIANSNQFQIENNIFKALFFSVNEKIKIVIVALISLILFLLSCFIMADNIVVLFVVVFFGLTTVLTLILSISEIKKGYLNLKNTKEIIVEDDDYYIIYKNNQYTKNSLTNIYKIKQFLNYTLFITYSNEIFLLKNVPENLLKNLNDCL